MTFVEILQKSMTDRTFSSRIISDPAGALEEAGVTPTHEKVQALKNAANALLAANFIIMDTEDPLSGP